MEAANISRLSDEELRSTMAQNGLAVGPITSSTRPLFEKKLLRFLRKGLSDNDHAADEQQSKCDGEGIKSVPKPQLSMFESQGGSGDVPLLFYAVQMPLEARNEANCSIFTNKREALQNVKKIPGSRFKIFTNIEEARIFSRLDPNTIPPSPKPMKTKAANSAADQSKPAVDGSKPAGVGSKPASDGSSFKSLKPPELSQFRRSIESGNIEAVKAKIWSNPRYLISSGDTPTILQENFRYNALHVCATKNQPRMAETLLDVIQCDMFQLLMYPDDDERTRRGRIHFLTDLYLNMPDKGLNETPLHFACKFGHQEVVRVLTSQPLTDKTRVNKHGETARKITCNRMRIGPGNTKEVIHSYLEDQCYVPLMRVVDDSEPASVIEPILSQMLPQDMSTTMHNPRRSPHSSPLSIAAVAGPMSPLQAEKFRKDWTTPPSPSVKDKKQYAEIRRGDCNKGLERIGRSLAHNMRIQWSEHWDFLCGFCDLSTPEGLQQLENYLQAKYQELCKELSLSADLQEIDDLFSSLTLDLDAKTNRTPVRNSVAAPSNFASSSRSDIDSLAASVFGGVKVARQSVDDVAADDDVARAKDEQPGDSRGSGEHMITPVKQFDWSEPWCKHSEDSANNSVHMDDDDEVEDELVNGHIDITTIPKHHYNDDDVETFYSARSDVTSSPHGSDCENDFEECFDSPPGVAAAQERWRPQPDRLFIYGNEPCKTDVDVLRAIDVKAVSPVQHPHVFQWRNSVLSVSDHTRNHWSSTPPRSKTPTNRATPRHVLATPDIHQSPVLRHHRRLTPTPGNDDDDDAVNGLPVTSPDSSSDDSSLSSPLSRDSTLRSIRTNLVSDLHLL